MIENIKIPKIIDIHTHAFVEHLAERAVASLITRIQEKHPEYISQEQIDGSPAGLIARMNNANVDLSVIQPIVTKQSQTETINNWAAEINNKYKNLICFGSIFPHSDGDLYKKDIDLCVNLGLKGLKFHAEYQDFILDEPKMLKIYDYALSKNLIIMHHAGADFAFNAPFRSTPKQFANIARELKGGVIIAAHLGGHKQWEEVYNYLAGENIYFDTCMGFEYYNKEQFIKILQKHGSDKILFGSDSPWSNTKREIEILNGIEEISQSIKEQILCGNAKRILNI